MASASDPSTTTIFELNDDCLRDLFQYFNAHDLDAVVDVCSRFRSLAKERFSSLKSKGFVFGNIYHKCSSNENRFYQTAKFFRDFGAFVEQIIASCKEIEVPNYAAKFIELLERYCSEKLVLLEIWHLDMDADIEQKMRNPLEHLQSLVLKKCSLTESFLKQLPSLSPRLKSMLLVDIETSGAECLIGLQQNYAALERVLFENVGMCGSDIEGFFRSNPQLKTINLENCRKLDDDIIPMLATHVPNIEGLYLHFDQLTDHLKENLKHLSALKSLSELALASTTIDTKILDVCEIGFSEIPLETLLLHNFNVGDNVRNFAAEISKLVHLKTLELWSVDGLNDAHIVDICEKLSELRKLSLRDLKFVMPIENLTQIIRKAEKLDMFCHTKNGSEFKKCIDSDTYKTIVSIIQGREGKRFSKLKSDCYCFHSIPKELMEAHKNYFKHIRASEISTDPEKIDDVEQDTMANAIEEAFAEV